MPIYEELSETIRRIALCGGTTTCPVALSESDVAAVAEAEGLRLAGHPERSFVAEAAEAFASRCAEKDDSGRPACAPACMVAKSDLARLLKANGTSVRSAEHLECIAARTEHFIRWAARRVVAIAGCDSPPAASIKEALIQALSTN